MINQIKKYQKWQEKFLSLLLASTIPLSASGCNLSSTTSQPSNQEPTTEATSTSPLDESQLTSENIETNYLDYFSTMNVIFDWEEYYITYEAIETYLQSLNSIIECQYTTLDNIDISDLVVTIKHNTEEYLQQHPEYNSPFENDEDRLFITSLINILVDWQASADSNIVEDFHKMQTLKIVNVVDENITYEGKYDSQDNLIILNFATINSSYQAIQFSTPSYSYANELTLTLTHELNHLRQLPCDCQKTNNLTSYPIKYTEDAGTLLIESSAESSLYNEYNQSFLCSGVETSKLHYTYSTAREYESLLWLLGLFSNQTIDDYYRAIFNSDIEALHDFYDVETPEDIYKLYKIIYALDSSVSMTNLSNVITEKYPTNPEDLSIGDLQKQVGTKWRASLFQLILKQMVAYTTANSDFSLEENIVIFNYIKNKITANSYLDILEEPINDGVINYQYIYDDETVKYIKEFEQSYVDFLTTHYQTTEEEIRLYEQTTCKNIIFDIESQDNFFNNDITENLLTKFPLINQIKLPYTISNEYELFLEKTENINSENNLSSPKKVLTNNYINFNN